jgi:putative transposase
LKRQTVDPGHPEITVDRQCELLGLARSSYYYRPLPVGEFDLSLTHLIDGQYTRTPFYGIRRMTAWLRRQGCRVNHKRVARLMRETGIVSLHPKPSLSKREASGQVHPYLLRNVTVDRPDQVWSTDITYIRMRRGFVYLTAVMDWHSRYVQDSEPPGTKTRSRSKPDSACSPRPSPPPPDASRTR